MEVDMDNKSLQDWLNKELFKRLSRGDEKDVEALIQLGADIKSFSPDSIVEEYANKKMSLLSVACNRGSLKLVELLVKAGANVNKYEENLLRSEGGLYMLTPIAHAVCDVDGCCHHDIVAYLANNGADLNWVGLPKEDCNPNDKEIDTLIKRAIRFGNYETVKLLIEKGAPLNIGDPLNYAKERLEYEKSFTLYRDTSKYEKTVEVIENALKKSDEKSK